MAETKETLPPLAELKDWRNWNIAPGYLLLKAHPRVSSTAGGLALPDAGKEEVHAWQVLGVGPRRANPFQRGESVPQQRPGDSVNPGDWVTGEPAVMEELAIRLFGEDVFLAPADKITGVFAPKRKGN